MREAIRIKDQLRLRAAAVAVRERDPEDIVEIGSGFDGGFAGKHRSPKCGDVPGHGFEVAAEFFPEPVPCGRGEHRLTPEGITGELPDFLGVKGPAATVGRRVLAVEVFANIAPQLGNVAAAVGADGE